MQPHLPFQLFLHLHRRHQVQRHTEVGEVREVEELAEAQAGEEEEEGNFEVRREGIEG